MAYLKENKIEHKALQPDVPIFDFILGFVNAPDMIAFKFLFGNVFDLYEIPEQYPYTYSYTEKA